MVIQMISCSGPPGAARASTRRATSGSSTSGGAWCGLSLPSITSGPRQPQCLSWTNDSMPYTSAAGFARVKVTQRKFRSDSVTNWLSSTTTIQRKAAIGSSGLYVAQKFSIAAKVDFGFRNADCGID